MKMLYIIIGVIIIAGIVIFLAGRKNSGSRNSTVGAPVAQQDTSAKNPYHDLRNMALQVTPQQLQLTVPANETKVFGVVVDWDLGEGIATIVSFETGDASMYLSSGGGMIGGSGHETVANAAKTLVAKAQGYLSNTTKTDSTPGPDKNGVRFYFLTNKGKFTAKEQMQNFDNNTSIWLPLFTQANDVITALREVEENKSR